MSGVISNLAIELRFTYGGPAVEWQEAIDGVGSEERARWLVENAWPDGSEPSWTRDALLLAHAAARLLEDGPSGTQPVYVAT